MTPFQALSRHTIKFITSTVFLVMLLVGAIFFTDCVHRKHPIRVHVIDKQTEGRDFVIYVVQPGQKQQRRVPVSRATYDSIGVDPRGQYPDVLLRRGFRQKRIIVHDSTTRAQP